MTEQQKAEQLIVDLDNVRQNNIVYVDLSRQLTETVFLLEYEKAARVISRILDENEDGVTRDNYTCRECKTRTSRACEACKFRDYVGCRGDNTGKHWTEYQTAVPFIGDRGTGKSSVMHSVLRRLQNYNGHIPGAAFNLDPTHDSVNFITFEIVDASKLTQCEDVMEIILARMLSYLDKIQPDHDFRDLYRQIDELSSAMSYLRGDNRKNQSTYGLMDLQKVVDSQSAIEGFRKLVADFLQAMSAHKYNCRKCYLVIALDDIDMYQGSTCGMYSGQFALLEHIYNHMRIPGLIVLMTYNEHILRRTCNRHFNRIYFGEEIARKYTPTEQNDIDTLTSQFMSKLFPQEQRIYMPNFMLIDSANRSNLFVRPEITENGERKLLVPFEKSDAIPVKNFMLRLIAHKTGVYFDSSGSKIHFFEPRNLRNLGELFEVIHSMEEVDEATTERRNIHDRNRKALLKYMYNQFALSRLSPDEQDRFRKLSALPITRQHRTLVDWVRTERMRISEKSDLGSFGYLAKSEKYRWRYSYGELLHNVFFATRLGTTAGYGESFLSKAFMHCIFGTHSVILNNIIRAHSSRQDMLEIIGSSVTGRWANEMLPSFYVEDISIPCKAGSISLPIRDYFGWAIPKCLNTAILNSLQTSENEKLLEEFFEALFFTGMFFTGYSNNGLGIYLDADMDEKDGAVLCLKSRSEEHICFNVMNFVINSYRALPEAQAKKREFLNKMKNCEDILCTDVSVSGYLPYMYQKLRTLGKDVAQDLETDWTANEKNAETLLKLMEGRAERRYGRTPRVQSTRQREVDNATRALNRAKAWKVLTKADEMNESILTAGIFDREEFVIRWNRVLSNATRHLFIKFQKWEALYGQHKMVLPVENFDMMYNIVKRLAGVYYHDIPAEASADEVCKHYINLYKSVLDELELQDKVYFSSTSKGSFANIFRNSVFYQEVVEADEGHCHTEFLHEILTNLIRSTIIVQNIRHNAQKFELPI